MPEWYSGVCKCYLEYDANSDGALANLILARACEFHKALDGKPELFDLLRAEGGTMSHAVTTLRELEPDKEISYAFDADRKLSVTVKDSSLSKLALQTAVDTVLGSGKVTVS